MKPTDVLAGLNLTKVILPAWWLLPSLNMTCRWPASQHGSKKCRISVLCRVIRSLLRLDWVINNCSSTSAEQPSLHFTTCWNIRLNIYIYVCLDRTHAVYGSWCTMCSMCQIFATVVFPWRKCKCVLCEKGLSFTLVAIWFQSCIFGSKYNPE